MQIITILIAGIIAAAVSYALHIVDKNNQSMEKVKRYADKRLGEFDSYFHGKEKNLSNVTAELDTKQIQAVAAVNRLEKQIADFKKMTENLSSDSNAVKNIEEKINSYDKFVNELIEMTAKVEQNLEALKKESLIIEKVNYRLNEQKGDLDKLEKRIPEISKEFSTKNGEQLKALGNRLLSEYDSHGEKLKADFIAIEDGAKKALNSFQQEINGVYEEASLKAEKLEDEAFLHLSKRTQDKTDSYTEQLEQKAEELQNQIDEKFNALQALLEGKSSALAANADSKVLEFDKKYNQIYQELSIKFKQKSSEIEQKIDNSNADINSQLKESSDSVIEKLKEKFVELDSKCRDYIDSFSNDCGEKINSLCEKYNKQLELVGGKSDSRLADLQQKISETEEKCKKQKSVYMPG